MIRVVFLCSVLFIFSSQNIFATEQQQTSDTVKTIFNELSSAFPENTNVSPSENSSTNTSQNAKAIDNSSFELNSENTTDDGSLDLESNSKDEASTDTQDKKDNTEKHNQEIITLPITDAISIDKEMPYFEDRPMRSVQTQSIEEKHHAGTYKMNFVLPFGDAQFEKYRAEYFGKIGQIWLERVYERSRPYSKYIYEKIREYELPEELFFLPFLESEFYSSATSRSGAAGIWQFMRISTYEFKLKMNDWVDERRDFLKSTDAALKKLKANYEMFGDWMTAIAAYNCGSGAMKRAIEKAGTNDYWALRAGNYLPKETCAYIPKYLAIISVAKYGGRNKLNMSWTSSINWKTISINRPIDITMLSTVTGIPVSTLRLGNSELKYNVTPPESAYTIKVPAEYSEKVKEVVSSKDILMSVYMHKVGIGDTLSAIASYYEVPISMIVKMNNNINPNRIQIGQKLVIPALKDKKPFVSPKAADDSKTDFSGTYTVKKGESLWSIAMEYGIRADLLAQKNGLDFNGTLHEGESIKVPINKE